MRVFYANNKFARYRIEGAGYFVSIIAASFYILLTIALLTAIAFSIFPSFYKLFVDAKINSNVFAISCVLTCFLLLRTLIKEDTIRDNDFTKEYIDRIINYLIAYSLITVILIGAIIMNFVHS